MAQDDFEVIPVSGDPDTVEYKYVETPGADSIADNLPSDVTFDVMATGGRATVCAATPTEGTRSESYQSEAELEAAFIKQLQRQAYEYVVFKD